MEKNEKKLIVPEKVEYNLDVLLSDIQDFSDEKGEASKDNEKTEREFRPKMIVMQMLINIAASYSSVAYSDNRKLYNAIETKVNNDELLSGYMFYVSQNPQFDYSWNYMRKCENNYKAFLANGVRFLNNVLADINMIVSMHRSRVGIHMVFNDVFDVSLTNEKPYVKTRVLWNNFYHLASVSEEYNISIKEKDNLLIARRRKDPSDVKRLIDSVYELLNEPKSILK